MARIEFLLEEQTADMRSFEFAYRFKVQNNGSSAFNLLAVTPRLAKGIERPGMSRAQLPSLRRRSTRNYAKSLLRS